MASLLPKCEPQRQPSKGFTYIGLLIFIALIGLISATSLSVGRLLQRRSTEQELLYIGNQYRNALKSYYNSTPAGQRPYPTTLEDLVRDPRFPQTVRHLRKLYADPFTGKADWITTPAPTGGIMGISSKSKEHPIKVGNFAEADKVFEEKSKYSEWIFFYSPPLVQGIRKN